jgi:hypothetical protein
MKFIEKKNKKQNIDIPYEIKNFKPSILHGNEYGVIIEKKSNYLSLIFTNKLYNGS